MNPELLSIENAAPARGRLRDLQKNLTTQLEAVETARIAAGAHLLVHDELPPDLDQDIARAERGVAALRAAITFGEAAVREAERQDVEATVQRGLAILADELLPELREASDLMTRLLVELGQAMARLHAARVTVATMLGHQTAMQTEEGWLVNPTGDTVWRNQAELRDSIALAVKTGTTTWEGPPNVDALLDYFEGACRAWATAAMAGRRPQCETASAAVPTNPVESSTAEQAEQETQP